MFLFQPQIGLHLRVNHKGPSFTVFKNNCIVNANLIGRKTLTGPFRDLDWIAENLFETDIW